MYSALGEIWEHWEKSGITGGNEVLRLLDKGDKNTGIHDLRVYLKVVLVGILKLTSTATLNTTRLRF